MPSFSLNFKKRFLLSTSGWKTDGSRHTGRCLQIWNALFTLKIVIQVDDFVFWPGSTMLSSLQLCFLLCHVKHTVLFIEKDFNLSDIWSQISIGNCIFPFSNNISFPIRRAGESEWLLEPALKPATRVRSPALAPGGPSVGLPCEFPPLYFILCQFTGIQLLLCAFCNVKALLDKI